MVSQRMFIGGPIAQHQLVIRSMARRKIDSTWEAVSGMTYFNQWSQDQEVLDEPVIPELRPHIEMGNRVPYKRFKLEHRYMMEARFFHNTNANRTDLTPGYYFGNLRFRYRIQAVFKLFNINKDLPLRFRVGNEIMLNAGSNIVINTFDQNRVYFSFFMPLGKNLEFEFGYLNWYQQTPAGTYFNRNIITTALRQDIRLKPRK